MHCCVIRNDGDNGHKQLLQSSYIIILSFHNEVFLRISFLIQFFSDSQSILRYLDTSFKNERNKPSSVTSKNDLGLTIDTNFCDICVILQLKKTKKERCPSPKGKGKGALSRENFAPLTL